MKKRIRCILGKLLSKAIWYIERLCLITLICVIGYIAIILCICGVIILLIFGSYILEKTFDLSYFFILEFLEFLNKCGFLID